MIKSDYSYNAILIYFPYIYVKNVTSIFLLKSDFICYYKKPLYAEKHGINIGLARR